MNEESHDVYTAQIETEAYEQRLSDQYDHPKYD